MLTFLIIWCLLSHKVMWQNLWNAPNLNLAIPFQFGKESVTRGCERNDLICFLSERLVLDPCTNTHLFWDVLALWSTWANVMRSRPKNMADASAMLVHHTLVLFCLMPKYPVCNNMLFHNYLVIRTDHLSFCLWYPPSFLYPYLPFVPGVNVINGLLNWCLKKKKKKTGRRLTSWPYIFPA